MSLPHTEGPGPPDSVTPPPEHRVNGLTPFVHVEDVESSIAFYHHLGFVVASVYKYRGRPAWAALRSEAAELMVSTDGNSIDPSQYDLQSPVEKMGVTPVNGIRPSGDEARPNWPGVLGIAVA